MAVAAAFLNGPGLRLAPGNDTTNPERHPTMMMNQDTLSHRPATLRRAGATRRTGWVAPFASRADPPAVASGESRPLRSRMSGQPAAFIRGQTQPYGE